jgi:hypothetical protein
MPDILTHVIVGNVLGTLLAMRVDQFGPSHVTLVMLGALTPDLTKISLVTPSSVVEATLGLPFNWFAFHVLGGNLVVVLLGTLLVASEHRKDVFLLLALGAASHHTLDLLLINVTGYTYQVLWPLTEYHPPAGMLYLSTDRWPALIAGTSAVGVWLIQNRVTEPATD